MDKIIDGQKLAEKIRQEIKQEIYAKKLKPSLAVILVGDDPASHLYVSKKKKASKEVGIEFHQYLMDKDTPEEKIISAINFLNNDPDVDAILVQLPLPKNLDTDKIIKSIDPRKDVDGFHPQNIKDFLNNKALIIPGLPLGILKLMESTKEDLADKKAAIISRSSVFCQPMEKILLDKKMTVEIIRPDDKNLKNKCLEADLLIVSCGQPFFISADMVKKDSIIIDVGTNKIDNDCVVGDVDYSAVFDKVKFITPVPGGVGPMTVAMLLYNTVKLAEAKI